MKTRSGEMEEERYLYGIVGAKVILINGLQPSDIIVRVRDQMNIELRSEEHTSELQSP